MMTPKQVGAPLELIRWDLAEQFGWTLDYIDSLSVDVLHEYMAIRDGRGKFQEIRKGRK